METLRATPGAVVEVLGWDEAFVGLETDDPLAAARAIQAAVLEATALHCSVGIGDTLVRAKIATDFGKPQGTFRLDPGQLDGGDGRSPDHGAVGVGAKIGARLEAIGIRTVADLAAADTDALVAAFGPASGAHLGRLGRGGGRDRPDDTPWVAAPTAVRRPTRPTSSRPTRCAPHCPTSPRGSWTTYATEDRAVQRVHLKVRFAPFFTFTKVRKLPEPTNDVDVIAATAYALYLALDDQRPVRLLGVRGEMVPPEGGY